MNVLLSRRLRVEQIALGLPPEKRCSYNFSPTIKATPAKKVFSLVYYNSRQEIFHNMYCARLFIQLADQSVKICLASFLSSHTHNFRRIYSSGLLIETMITKKKLSDLYDF